MKKRIDTERLTETEGPMNAAALEEARYFLGLQGRETLTPVEEKQLRAKKKKIVTSAKKMERRYDRELTRHANRLK